MNKPDKAKKNKEKKKWVLPLVIVLVVLALAGGAVAIYFIFFAKVDENIPSEAGLKGDNPNLSYVCMVSDESCLIGYWEAEDAGMYIGYSVSGGNEGFTIYLATQESGYLLLNPVNHVEFSGDYGKIICDTDKDFNYFNSRPKGKSFTFEIKDETHLTIHMEQNDENSLSKLDYEFTKSELTIEKLSDFTSEWVYFNPEMGFGYKKLEWYEDFKTVFSLEYYEMDCDDTMVTLYDGRTVLNIFPYPGLYDLDNGLQYPYYSYTIDGDVLSYECDYAVGFGSMGDEYCRADCEDGKIITALKAYSDYLYENYGWVGFDEYGYWTCKLIYVDEDDVPELLYDYSDIGDGAGLLSYYDGKVYDNPTPGRDRNFSYAPKQNSFYHMYDRDMVDRGGYAHLEKGQLVYDYEVCIDYAADGETLYYINGQNYTKDEYEEFCETNVKYYDNLIWGWKDWSTTLVDAYNMAY
ncbi:MAG: hypothetical protein ACI4D8_07690 [Wujia sp.]